MTDNNIGPRTFPLVRVAIASLTDVITFDGVCASGDSAA